MKRMFTASRDDWAIEDFDRANFDHPDGRIYWVEDACYVFTPAEIERLHAAAEAVLACVNAAVTRAFEQEGLNRLALPIALQPAAMRSWARRDPSLYGRFDFVFDADGAPKLLEFNADTPTALYEAAVMQWNWIEDRDREGDQYNRIHEALVARFRELGRALPAHGPMHFACMRAERDDRITTDYLRDCARQAGLATEALDLGAIGVRDSRIVDLFDRPITHLFKLYPWEWIANEPFGEALLRADPGMIEPPWRLAASSKLLLADLWEMFPEHENLLPAFRALSGQNVDDYLAKSAFGREGEGVRAAWSPPNGPFVYQKRVATERFEGRHAVLGVWVVGDQACGMGVREDAAAITGGSACFVPHRIEAGA